MSLVALVLAAGQGTRMKSSLPKMLHPIAGRPLLHYPVRAALDAGAERAVVIVSASSRDAIVRTLADGFGAQVEIAVQEPPRGTGDAARVGLAAAGAAERMLVVCGDTPLVTPESLRRLLESLDAAAARNVAVLSCLLDDPMGYGRVLRDAAGRVTEIREHRDLRSDAERAVREVNAGAYAARAGWLSQALARLEPTNAQGEYYLTDVVADAARAASAEAIVGSREDLVGVNDRAQLAEAEALMLERIANRHRRAGVTVQAGVRIDDTVEIEPDAVIASGACLRGATRVAQGALIDAGCVVDDSSVGAGTVVKPYSVLSKSRVGERAQIGPFAHLRPDSDIEAEAHVGNFVETKKTRMGKGSKANHLAYLGDGDVGAGANIGAGTIFCNYDGFQKHRTTIGEGAFIGSDSQIVAPLTVGKNAYVATGTTVTKDVPEDALAIARVKQENKLGYGPKLRARLKKK